MGNLFNMKNIPIEKGLTKYVGATIVKEDLEVLSRISNGPGGYNISKIFPEEKLPDTLLKVLRKGKIPMMISFYHVGWHDDKGYATKTYPWFAIYVLETHNKDFYLEIGKRGKTESIKLKKGAIYYINTRIKHRVKYNGEVDGLPCSLVVMNTNLKHIT